ncbi:MAG: hypothetical protein V7686_13300, partial [Qipengyuania sp.]
LAQLNDQAPNRRADPEIELQGAIIGRAGIHQICRKIFHVAMNSSIEPSMQPVPFVKVGKKG